MEIRLSYPWLPIGDVHEVTCCVCKGRHRQSTVFSFTINDARMSVRRCFRDHIMYLYPQPGDSFLRELYGHSTYYTGVDDMFGMNLNDAKSRNIAQLRVGEIKRYASKARSLLEIGAGFGHLLEEARKQGFENVLGLEYSREAVEAGEKRGITLMQCDINTTMPVHFLGDYDVIASYSNLEHLKNPCLFLEMLRKHMRKNAMLFLRVPETDPDQGPSLSLLDHLWHFTRTGLRQILEAKNFTVVDIFESGTFHGIQHPGIQTSMTFVVAPTAL